MSDGGDVLVSDEPEAGGGDFDPGRYAGVAAGDLILVWVRVDDGDGRRCVYATNLEPDEARELAADLTAAADALSPRPSPRGPGGDRPPSLDWLRRAGFGFDPTASAGHTQAFGRRLDDRTGLEVVALVVTHDADPPVIDGWRQRLGSSGELRALPPLTTRERVRFLFAAFNNPLPAGV